MKNKIGIVSLCADWTRTVADAVNEATGRGFVVFNEIAEDWCEDNITNAGKNSADDRRWKKAGKRDLVRDIFLPVLGTLRDDIVLFDIQPLMHDKFVESLRDKYDLIWLKADFENISGYATGAEKALHNEHTMRLLEICTQTADFDKLGYEGGIKWLINMIRKRN